MIELEQLNRGVNGTMKPKTCMMRNIPYFESWDLWYKMLDTSGKDEQRYIADVAYKYLEKKHKKPEKNSPKAIWQAFHEAALVEGISIAALIEKAVAEELGTAFVQAKSSVPLAQASAPQITPMPATDIGKPRQGLGSIFDLNRDAHKPPVTTK